SQAVCGNECRQILGSALAMGSGLIRGRESACFDILHRGLGNGIRVISDVVLDTVAMLPHVVGPDFATILQVNYVSGAAHGCAGYKEESGWQEEDDTCTH